MKDFATDLALFQLQTGIYDMVPTSHKRLLGWMHYLNGGRISVKLMNLYDRNPQLVENINSRKLMAICVHLMRTEGNSVYMETIVELMTISKRIDLIYSLGE